MSDDPATYPIPHISRETVDRVFAGRSITPAVTRRPVAHVLTILALTPDGPTYTFECRVPAGDLDKRCAASIVCECDDPTKKLDDLPEEDASCPRSPTGRHELRDGFLWRPALGCSMAYADNEELDDAVRLLFDEHDLTVGVYFVHASWDLTADEIELELLARMCSMVGDLPTPRSYELRAEPTKAMRYPGYGPEVDLRELIEAALADHPGALIWDDEEATITVDASEAAKKALAWFEDRYDVPADQRTLSLLPARIRRPVSDAPRVITTRIGGDVL